MALHATAGSRLARFVAELEWTSVPPAIRTLVRDHVLDTIGCILAAVGGTSWAAATRTVSADGGFPQATAAGCADLVTCRQAAQVNGVLARSLEFDDMAMPDLHPSGVVVPAVLAVGEHRGATGETVLAATAGALEALVRLGRAGFDPRSRTSRFLLRGQDSSAICGTVAAAAGAARLMGLDAEGAAHAIGIAVTMSAGSLEANRSGGSVKQFNSGRAAEPAVEAASLAVAGVTGPPTSLEGRYGFCQCFLDGDFDLDVLAGDLGNRWEIADLRYKPYPSNYYTQAGVDAALALRDRGLRAADVASLRLGVALPMLHTMGEPTDVKQRPADGYAAKFSGPYTVACALLGGSGLGLGLDDFRDQLVRDPERVALMARVEVEANERCDAIFPEHAPAIVDAVTTDGTRWHEEVLTNRGSLQRPLTPDEVAAKFATNAGPTLPAEQVEVVRDAVWDLGGAADVSTVVHSLRAARRLR